MGNIAWMLLVRIRLLYFALAKFTATSRRNTNEKSTFIHVSSPIAGIHTIPRVTRLWLFIQQPRPPPNFFEFHPLARPAHL